MNMFMLLLISLLVGLVLILVVGRDGTFGKTTRRIAQGLGWSALTLFGIVLFSPIFFEYAPASGKIYIQERNGTLTPHDFGAFRWDQRYLLMGNQKIEISNAVTFLTENPKMRKLEYVLSVSISHPERLLAKIPNTEVFSGPCSPLKIGPNWTVTDFENWGATGKLTRKVMEATYKFNGEHSKDLTGFDNPLDQVQIKRLSDLIEPSINEQVNDYGIKVDLKGFYLE